MRQGEGNSGPRRRPLEEAKDLMGAGAWPMARPRPVHLAPLIRCHLPLPLYGKTALALGPGDGPLPLLGLSVPNCAMTSLVPGSSHRGLAVTNLTSFHEDAVSIPGLAQWVKDAVLL